MGRPAYTGGKNQHHGARYTPRDLRVENPSLIFITTF
jgi:hypothetical protein